jgi:hypothetical protein
MNSALVGVGFALIEIRDELRRLNDGRDQFNAAMLEFFERLTERSSEGPSGAGATAQVVEPEPSPCVICGREGNRYRVCLEGPLTQEQWDKHAEDVYDEHREYGAGKDTAWAKALEKTSERFGPRPAQVVEKEGP